MARLLRTRSTRLAVCTLAALALFAGSTALAGDQVSRPFAGKAVNGGAVTVTQQGGKTMLTLSKDVQVPGSPDPHWQIVDSKGTVYLLDRVTLKDDKIAWTVRGQAPVLGHPWCTAPAATSASMRASA